MCARDQSGGERTSYRSTLDQAAAASRGGGRFLQSENVPLRGLLADNVYQDLVNVFDPEERKRRIIAASCRFLDPGPRELGAL